jgi:ATP synthase protein I
MADNDRRSPMSVGIGWAASLSTLGLEFALPVFLGHFFDVWLGTNPFGLFAGMVVGFVIGMMHVLRIARDASKPR